MLCVQTLQEERRGTAPYVKSMSGPALALAFASTAIDFLYVGAVARICLSFPEGIGFHSIGHRTSQPRGYVGYVMSCAVESSLCYTDLYIHFRLLAVGRCDRTQESVCMLILQLRFHESTQIVNSRTAHDKLTDKPQQGVRVPRACFVGAVLQAWRTQSLLAADRQRANALNSERVS